MQSAANVAPEVTLVVDSISGSVVPLAMFCLCLLELVCKECVVFVAWCRVPGPMSVSGTPVAHVLCGPLTTSRAPGPLDG